MSGIPTFVLSPAEKGAQVRENRRTPEGRLAEAVSLTQAIDLEIVDARIVPLARILPATYIGRGKVEELAEEIKAREIELVVWDAHLSPLQQRNLEREWKCKVIDRTALILEIFGERAQTKEGRLQVELASMEYQKSRLVRSWTHLERQRGGAGFMGGPGEKQIESDRRQIQERITALKQKLEKVRRTRELHRKKRRDIPYPVIALVGYTNAGKSTLFNYMTGASVTAQDALFATLDPTLRAIRLPSGRKVILSDTVGFVSDLPTQLVMAFRATLEEVLEADILIHVRDITHPDTDIQKEDVTKVLKEMGIDIDVPLIEVLNKIDMADEQTREQLDELCSRSGDVLAISAFNGSGVSAIAQRIDELLDRGSQLLNVTLHASEGEKLSWLYRHAEICGESQEDENLHLKVRMSPANEARWHRKLEKQTVLE